MRRQILAVAAAVLLPVTTHSAWGGIQYTVTDLSTLGGSYCWPYGINANGQVVGDATKADHSLDAFLYSNGEMTDLGCGDGFGINASGQVTGDVQLDNGNTHAFLYSNGTMISLGTLGGSLSYATGINANGQVVGGSTYTSDSLNDHAFLYSHGKMIDLGTLGGSVSLANGISSNGQVVGDADIGGSIYHAFLYSNGAMTDLNTLIDPASGWMLSNATAINDSGQIVGEGINPQGQQHAFLLTPVPEPSTIVLLGIGAVSLPAYVWRRRRRAA